MYAGEIIEILKQDSCVMPKLFKGVFSSDTIPLLNDNVFVLITNTKQSNEQGEHWVAVYRNDDKTYFMDSFGRTPNQISRKFAKNLSDKKITKFISNRKSYQHILSESCGLFTIVYVLAICHGLEQEEFLNYFKENDQINNELKVHYFLRKYLKQLFK